MWPHPASLFLCQSCRRPQAYFFLSLSPSLLLSGRPSLSATLEQATRLPLRPHPLRCRVSSQTLARPLAPPPHAPPPSPPRPRPSGLALPLTGLGVHGEVVLAVQHAVHQPSAAAVRGVIRIRGHHLHHRRAWARGDQERRGGVTQGPLCLSSPPQGSWGRRYGLEVMASPLTVPIPTPTPNPLPDLGPSCGSSMTMESEQDSNLPLVAPSCRKAASLNLFPRQQMGVVLGS